MTEQQVWQKEVHLFQLPAALRALNAAWRSSAGGANTSGSVSQYLRARCIQCGISLTEGELEDLITLPSCPTRPDPRLNRIQQGYCARRTCDSYYDEMTVTSGAPIDAESLWNAASNSLIGTAFSGGPERRRSWVEAALASYSKREILALTGALLTVSFLIWWNFRTPSWARRSSGSEYQSDPQSLIRELQP